jgi:hypothetical protein
MCQNTANTYGVKASAFGDRAMGINLQELEHIKKHAID